MKFSYLTAFPQLITNYFQDGLLAKACERNLLQYEITHLRDFAHDKYKSIDDKPYGGCDGMLLTADIIAQALQKYRSTTNFNSHSDESSLELQSQNETSSSPKRALIYLSPQGEVFNQKKAKYLLNHFDELVLICGRYAGIDQRVIVDQVDFEISVGDYVLNGGELAALVVTEAVSRLIPGFLGDQSSAEKDSFAQEGLLEAPQFTRPPLWRDYVVPEVLQSGHHQKIQEWQYAMSLIVTFKKRPDLFEAYLKKISFERASDLASLRREFLKKVLPYFNVTDEEKKSLGLTESDLKNCQLQIQNFLDLKG